MFVLNSVPSKNLFSSDFKILPMSINTGLSQYGKGIINLQKTLFDIVKKQKVEDGTSLAALIINSFKGEIALNTYPFRN